MAERAPDPSAPPLAVVRDATALRAAVAEWRRQGLSVGLVPTMGALHDGHIALIEDALGRADRVVASVFVNPAQFAAHEDLGTYPRREAEDAARLAEAGCHLLYAPDVATIYPPGFATRIEVAGPSAGLETDVRPHFFAGVAVVVAKLLIQAGADVAVFGEKDYQQLLVVRRLAADLDIATRIVGAPTVRDGHGLALSSRNAYLAPQRLAVARRLNGVLAEAAAQAASGVKLSEVETDATAALLDAGFQRIDYVAVRRADDLSVFGEDRLDGPGRVLAAAWLDGTRLIDNMAA